MSDSRLTPLLALGLVVFSSVTFAADGKKTEATTVLPAVSVIPAQKRDLRATVSFTGTVLAQDEILVTPQVESLRIVSVEADEGEMVKEGQVLARLDRASLEVALVQNAAQIDQAEAGAIEARQALERARSLARGGTIADAALDQRIAASRSADARLDVARAQQQDLELRLSRTEIKAPRAGLISRRNARIGQTASAQGEPLFRIVAEGRFDAEADLLETHLAALKVGTPAEVFVSGLEKPIAGKVRIVPSEVDRVTRLGRVRIDLDQAKGLKVGSFARGDIEIAHRKGTAVPTSALAFSKDGATLMVVNGEVAETRSVKVGLTSGRYTEIVDGVRENELVIARAGSFLRSGDRVKPVVEEAK